MSAVKSTPMLRQYLAIKAQVPDAILFYRMGDFYEMFFQDAETASQALEITLTSRNKNDESPVPMCGVPHRAAAGYIARLIERGFKVAVCDQVEDPAEARGLVRREVVRVITPGMVVDEELLDARSHTFILAAVRSAQRWGLACLDLSTGAFRATESDDRSAIVDEARRLAPREILLPESARLAADHAWVGRFFPETAVTYLEERAFDLRRGRERLTEQFGTLTLEGFGCEGFGPGLAAAGAVLHYVAETQKQRSAHIVRIEPYALDHALAIDEVSRQNLELARNLRTGSRRGTLIGVLDQTRTPMGARLLQDWLRAPLREAAAIEERLDAVGELKEKAGARRSLRERLKSVYDLERLNVRTVMGRANARDLVALKRSLQALPAIWAELAAMGSALLRPAEAIDALAGLAELVEAAVREDAPPTLNEGGLIRAGYNAELDELARVGSDAKGFLARLEAAERERTGIATLKVGYNKVFGYYIEVSKARAAAVPADYVRKQTLVNAERYITDELKRFETLALGAEERRVALELTLFHEVREQVAGHHAAIRAVAARLAALD
ncbi:MAG TPA: DNA mismatch repair protein MutS, partial [Desulfobacterales bacterium]|nr:DNA mismatch repair protein MutS [Desulfobacterales bacterium]